MAVVDVTSDGGGGRVLVVDADALARARLRVAIAAVGPYAVDEAPSLNRATRVAAVIPYVLIVMDRWLPDGDSLDVVPPSVSSMGDDALETALDRGAAVALRKTDGFQAAADAAVG